MCIGYVCCVCTLEAMYAMYVHVCVHTLLLMKRCVMYAMYAYAMYATLYAIYVSRIYDIYSVYA